MTAREHIAGSRRKAEALTAREHIAVSRRKTGQDNDSKGAHCWKQKESMTKAKTAREHIAGSRRKAEALTARGQQSNSDTYRQLDLRTVSHIRRRNKVVSSNLANLWRGQIGGLRRRPTDFPGHRQLDIHHAED